MATEDPKVEEVKEEKVEVPHVSHHGNKLPIILGSLLLAVLVFGLGAAAGRIGARLSNFGHPGFMSGLATDERSDFGHRGMGMHMGRFYQSSNQNRLAGVVTAVSDTQLTLAGGGSTNTVTLNSSTQYTNGTKAAINDSVVVVGTTNNETFTATRVIINP